MVLDTKHVMDMLNRPTQIRHLAKAAGAHLVTESDTKQLHHVGCQEIQYHSRLPSSQGGR